MKRKPVKLKPVDKYNLKKKPKMFPVDPDKIPEELKKISNWLNWKWKKGKKKWTKPPVNGTSINANLTFEEAYQNTLDDPDLGLGLSVHKNKLCALDWDNILNRKLQIKKKYQDLLTPFKDTYSEISPSLTGIRVLGFGKPDTYGAKKGIPLEVYNKGRYVTVTGMCNGAAGKPLIKITKKANKAAKKVDKMFGRKESRGKSGNLSGKGLNRSGEGPENNKNFIDIASKLPVISADDYDTWLKVGMALHYETNGEIYGLTAWVNWSRGSESFVSEEDCEDKWQTFRGSKKPVTIGSIRYLFNEILEAFVDLKNFYDDPDNAIVDFNKKFVCCLIRGKFVIISRSKKDLNYIDKNSFLAHYGNIFSDGIAKDGGVAKFAPFWMIHSNRNTADNVIFDPSDMIGYDKENSTYNIWNGFAVDIPEGMEKDQKKKKFGAGWERMLHHIENNLCCKNQDYIDYLIMWLANIIQNPGGERPGVAVSFYGKKGTGKGTLGNWFGELFGVHYAYCSCKDDLVGKYNGHLANSVFVFADEAYFPGDQAAEGKLKSLITEPSITMEEKFVPRFQIKNHVNILIASNLEWSIPATMDERRFFALEVSDKHAKDIDYFDPLNDQMKNGGLQAMFLDLRDKVKIDMKVLRNAPHTSHLLDQIEYNEDTVTAFWRVVYNEGGFKTSGLKGDLLKKDVHPFYLKYCDEMKIGPYGRKNDVHFWRMTNKVLPKCSKILFKGRYGSNLKIALNDLLCLLKVSFKRKEGLRKGSM